MKLSHADLSFNSIGTPESLSFGDVYFSNEDGIAESEYVFIQGNRLWEQWLNWQKSTFCIGETGFGTGLNYLLTAKRFEEFLQNYPQSPLKKLHYISLEKFPIETSALNKIYQQWPSLAKYSASVIRTYPPALEGIHRSFHNAGERASAITLDLILCEAYTGLSAIHNVKDGLVNAWYLDGFAPSKNQDMWHIEVLHQMARLSSPKATLSTFTAAGAVKRALQEAGFAVSKIKGFGRKREMIVAILAQATFHPSIDKQPPYFERISRAENKALASPKALTIIGGGIAAALLALRLVEQGIKVQLICKDKAPASGASGNPIAGFYPQLNAEAGVNSQFFVHAFLYARRFYDEFVEQGLEFEHDWCSVLQLGFNQNTQERLKKMRDKSLWPDELATVVSAQQASKIAGLDIPHSALHLPKGGWIGPVSLIKACLQKASNTGLFSALYQHEFLHYSAAADSKLTITLRKQDGVQVDMQTESLVIAAGADSLQICQQLLPMRLTRGQVEAIPTSKKTSKLKAVLCHKGYFTPAVNGYHALGSTYIKQDMGTEHRPAETLKNINMHKQAMQESEWMANITELFTDDIQGRAAIRCSTPDHLPLVGAMPDIVAQTQELADLYKALPAHRYAAGKNVNKVFILTGLGSRGITTAPILVDTLVAEITNGPFPLSTTLLNALMPNRFLVRSLIRQENYSANI
ncbi:bifunctional tRNA (5-methylaminomethyl-2-thiouridine)(34)-methyltransferase MnmD/FAD-dependent 5-carboxymethylaminomethyl-2-thiouridine(34) oxidoreductase MnmC [Glaciecola sp. SC05]|uniref:bifunctional tRNA (5-methylaminomethyl-2-thiouridine)(34)-methyltransferase MnmD/FAD-dependent 5-carboxymethylaminomethyl-2-thiouridine(34) oxidoreductase MnmC n=1 Tax=Glaciecola sp. SC05 TaxID=1987355 RepID=UPI0035285B5E